MKRIIGILLLILSGTLSLDAQLFQTDLDKGFKALDKNDFEKAIQHFKDELKDDSVSIGANYGLAQVYFSKGYSGFNVDKAYTHIRAAQTRFPSATKKQVATLTKLGITQASIDDLRKKIDDEIFSIAAAQFSAPALTDFIAKYPGNSNIADAKMLLEQLTLLNVTESGSEEALDEYIRKSGSGKQMDKAVKVRNQVAFQKAKAANTIEALNAFIEKYPDAEEIEEAKAALATLEFQKAKEENTMAAYDTFMVHHPEAMEYREAMTLRNQLAYIQLLEAQSSQKSAEIEQKDAKLEKTGVQLNWLLGGLGIVLI
ncbi:MAG TPA: hypothetical protein VK826_13980, partial [Bacteroidia bacterium]|nr:hypothetical protein [Bacteroidia bacterium]